MKAANRKYTLSPAEALVWSEKYDSTKKYIKKINSNRGHYAQFIHIYCEWANKTPDELLALKNAFGATEAEKLLDKFILKAEHIPATLRKNIAMSIKGFYRVNYRKLESEAGKMEVEQQKATTAPDNEKLRKLYTCCCNPRDKALVTLCSCSALALETITKLRWTHFEPDWEKQEIPHISIPSDIIKGHGKGKYRGTRQETFITPECKQALIEYRNWLKYAYNYTMQPDDYVFLIISSKRFGEPLGEVGVEKAIKRLCKCSSVDFRVHDGRRRVQTALESVGASPNWVKKIKGRKPSGEESPYSKPAIEQLRAKYREALPELEFLNQNTANINSDVVKIQAEKQMLEEELKRQKRELEEIRNALNKIWQLQAERGQLVKICPT